MWFSDTKTCSGTQIGRRLEPKPHPKLNRLLEKNATQIRLTDCKLQLNTQIRRLKRYKTKFLGFKTPKWVPGFGMARDQNAHLTHD